MENAVQTTKQATVPKQDVLLDHPPSEKKLVLKQRIVDTFNVALVLIGALLILVFVVQSVDASFFRPSTIVPWSFFAPAILVISVGLWGGIAYSNKCSKERRFLYQELQKGVIEGQIFDDETKYAHVVRVFVKGENRMGETRHQIVAISAKQWRARKYFIGQQLKL